jgi:N-methylhydantoinase A
MERPGVSELDTSGEWRVGVDIGGTFTDIVLAGPDGSVLTRKVASTTDDYGRGILQGLRALLEVLGLGGGEIGEIVHGTTVATNAILEYRGAKTGLLTTRGFRDVLELRRVRAPELYNARYRPPKPMVARRLRQEVDERLDAQGRVVRPLDEASVRPALQRFRAEGVEAVAVCFLHSYRDPAHERRVGEMVRAALPGVYLSLSVDVLPEIREYDRTSTTVINAYIGPIVRSYLVSLLAQLDAAGVGGQLLIMQSNGGIMSAEAATELPAQLVESGPAAGVIAAHRLAGRLDLPNLITFDMGGTTAKASLIEGGSLTQTTEYEVGSGISLSSRLVKGGGHALKLPVLDISEVGAGGGSVVWIDRGGALKVGPRSAGAQPGPACYGTGGAEPTATDANLVLGYLGAGGLAGGSVPIHPDLAHHVLEECVARPLGLTVLEAAYGVFTVSIANMIRAVKAVSTYRGRDPRDFTLLAFGGNGPIFAAEMARELGIRRVLVPPAAGLFSAFGLLEADLERHVVKTFGGRIEEIDCAALREVLREMEAKARAAVAGAPTPSPGSSPTPGPGSEEASTPSRCAARISAAPTSSPVRGGGEQGVSCRRMADLRYAGQAYELTVPAPDGEIGEAELRALAEAFGAEHERTYGHRATDEPIELVNLRMVARLDRPRFVPGLPLSPTHPGTPPGLSVSPVDRAVTPGLPLSSAGERDVGALMSSKDDIAADVRAAQRSGGEGHLPASAADGRPPEPGSDRNLPGTRGAGLRSRAAYFGPGHGTVETPVIARRDLTGAARRGPLIVEEYDATVVVPPDCLASLDPAGNIVIDVPSLP